MKRDAFAIDIDGVACDHATAVCEYVNQKFKSAHTRDEVASWDHDFGPITFVQAVEEAYPIPEFIARMALTPGFQRFSAEIQRRMDVVFVSARKEYCWESTCTWIREHFGEAKVIFRGGKQDIEAGYLIDDHPKNVLDFASEGRNAFLFFQPWNRNDETRKLLCGHPRCHLVQSFGEVLDHIDSATGRKSGYGRAK